MKSILSEKLRGQMKKTPKEKRCNVAIDFLSLIVCMLPVGHPGRHACFMRGYYGMIEARWPPVQKGVTEKE